MIYLYFYLASCGLFLLVFATMLFAMGIEWDIKAVLALIGGSLIWPYTLYKTMNMKIR